MPSRRRFLALGAALPSVPLAAAAADCPSVPSDRISLNGHWDFRLDTEKTWRTVTVPHTWQIEPAHTEYRGVAWYRREFDAPAAWAGAAVRVEFEAVFHSAVVSVNGAEVGRHTGKGYTAFTLDLGKQLRFGARNTILVRVDNAFNDSMLPRGRSSDWAHDGGIYRPVQLLVTPQVFIEDVAVDANPTSVRLTAVVRNVSESAWNGRIDFHAASEDDGLAALHGLGASVQVKAGETREVTLQSSIANPRLWHFDHPHLYRLTASLSNGHTLQTSFGIRTIEIRDGAFYLNGERVRLMGVERMAGSNPEFGMAEPAEWIDHDHRDMRELNCVYTRVHWPQDRRVLDWCDRYGMLIQTEVPTWGPNTFQGMTAEPDAAILQNGLEQLREMIARDRNHPCIFSWGVCNEIGGQNPPAYRFAKRLYDEAKTLDPNRLVTYASHSLRSTPSKDVAGLMDYIMWNEYYGSWYPGTPADLARNLDEIHSAFPDKPIVISEYGYCACTADRPEGDPQRIEILLAHDAVFREREFVGGLIFFCYNDYRTHVGDRGAGALRQRVHGVVDLFGHRKPSFEVLRRESSPVESLRVTGSPANLSIAVAPRRTVPSYSMKGYRLRAVAYGQGNIPVEQSESELAGQNSVVFSQPGINRVTIDILRPGGTSVRTGVFPA